MKLTETEVRYVAGLANLDLSDEEILRMSHDLGEVLTHIEQLNELDTKGIEPMTQVLFQEDDTAALREDVEHDSLSNEQALRNTARAANGYFQVPKVIER